MSILIELAGIMLWTKEEIALSMFCVAVIYLNTWRFFKGRSGKRNIAMIARQAMLSNRMSIIIAL